MFTKGEICKSLPSGRPKTKNKQTEKKKHKF